MHFESRNAGDVRVAISHHQGSASAAVKKSEYVPHKDLTFRAVPGLLRDVRLPLPLFVPLGTTNTGGRIHFKGHRNSPTPTFETLPKTMLARFESLR